MSSGVNERALIPSLSDCDPGLKPSEFNVLVLPEVTEEKTKGGIILPDAVKDADKAAGQRARIVAVSPVAFDYADFPEGSKPKAGDIVITAKYAGTMVKGLDEREYRIVKDRDVMAVEESLTVSVPDQSDGSVTELCSTEWGDRWVRYSDEEERMQKIKDGGPFERGPMRDAA